MVTAPDDLARPTTLQAVEDFAESLAQEAERYTEDGETGDVTAEWVRDRFVDWRERHVLGGDTREDATRALCSTPFGPECRTPKHCEYLGACQRSRVPADTDTGRGQ